jgi:hypothetical protein
MFRVVALITLFGASVFPLLGQSSVASGCLPRSEFAPVVLKKTENLVSFKCDSATPLELIRAVGFQTRLPIGVALGNDLDALSRTKHSYDLDRVGARSALVKAIEGTGYSITNENNVMVLIAPDLTPHQRDLLTHEYRDFKPGPNESMTSLGVMLTMWMRAAIDPKLGFATSILGSTNDERFALSVPSVATTEQIANEIVGQGSKGIWILRVSPLLLSGELSDTVDIEPYQHYTNASTSLR